MRELEVGKVIEKYRKRSGMSTDELALKLDIWNRYPPLWERGLMLPDAAWLAPIVEALDIPSLEAEIVLQKKDMLNINVEELVIPGLEKEYQFLHLADAHVIAMDEWERKELVEYQIPRTPLFTEDGIVPGERMEAFKAYIEEHKDELDGVLLTGDIIDCPFENSIRYLDELLNNLPVPYMYVLGNHDWLHFDEHGDKVKAQRHVVFDKFCSRDSEGDPTGVFKEKSFICKKKIGELTLIGIDNTVNNRYEPEMEEALSQMLAGEKHVLILQHEPFYADTLTADCKLWWHGNDSTMAGPGDCHREENARILKLLTQKDSPVRALITGHLHFHHKDLLENGIVQYIAADASNGGAILYKIHG